MQTLNSWPLRIAPAHSKVGEGAHLLQQKADCLAKKRCRADETTEERAARLQSLHSCQARRLLDETVEQQRSRLVHLNSNQEKHLETETEAQKQNRLQCLRANQELRLAGKTEEAHCARLQCISVPVFTCKANVEPISAKVG